MAANKSSNDSGSHILRLAGSNFVSVTDETSPDSRLTGRAKVPIYAQVLTEEPLDWFYDLISLFPDVPGELKGTTVAGCFDSLPAETRRRIWNGLRRVRIHLTDPRPYLARRDHIYREAIGLPFPRDELRHRARNGDEIADYLLRTGENFVAEAILLDSPPFRLAYKVLLVDEALALFAHDHDYEQPLGLDLEEQLAAITSQQQSPVTRAAEFASKSGSVFAGAIEEVLKTAPAASAVGRYGGSAEMVHRAVTEKLRDPHAYDRGDEKLLGRVETVRDKLGGQIQQMATPWAREPFTTSGLDGIAVAFAEPLGIIESSEVVEGQAGDIAARMAATIYEREGPMGLVKRFDFVSFNGQRMTENNLEEHLRQWEALD